MLIKTNALPLSQPPPPLDLATSIPSTVQSSFDLLVSVLSSYPLDGIAPLSLTCCIWSTVVFSVPGLISSAHCAWNHWNPN